jgi:predicted permease
MGKLKRPRILTAGRFGICLDNRRMLEIFEVTFPFFALVLCGYTAARRQMLPLVAIAGLNTFVLFFALPCMLYRFGANTPIAQLLDPAASLTYLVCAVSIVALVIAMSLRGSIGWNDAAFGALVGAFPNTGFLGVPLLVAILGKQAAGTAIVTILVDLVVTTSLCIALSRLGALGIAAGDDADRVSPAQAARNALRGVATNPMLWAILSGAMASAFAVVVPGPVDATLGLLADCASPVALFTIGAVLARSQIMAQEGQAPSVPWSDVLPVVAIKLLIHPLLVLAAGCLAQAMGAPLADSALTVMVLVAALPSASNVSMLAERFGANNGRIARIILVSTALAFFTFAAAVVLMTG